MSGGEHNAEAGSSHPKAYWELESQDPNYVPPAEEEMAEVPYASAICLMLA